MQAALPAYPRAVRGVGGRGYSTALHPVKSPLPPAHHQQDHTQRNVHAAVHQRTQQSSTMPTRHSPTARNLEVPLHTQVRGSWRSNFEKILRAKESQALEVAAPGSSHPPT